MKHPAARILAVLGVALCAASSSALAESPYPNKPLRMIVPLPPGGPTDVLARTVAQDMARTLGQPVVVENKAGADGSIAAREAIGSPADGYTILFAIGSMVAFPLQSTPPAFDWAAELAPVGRVARMSFVMAVHPDVPARTVAEFVAYARAHPDRLNFATSTLSELAAASQFMKAAGIRMTRVSYKGGTQAMPDVLAGRVQVMFAPVTLIAPQAQNGALRPLAVLLPQRSAALPDVPTMAEAGYAEVTVPTWQAVFVPAKAPPAVVERLAGALAATLAKPEVRVEIERRSIFVDYGTPAELARTIAQDQQNWTRLIAEHRIGKD